MNRHAIKWAILGATLIALMGPTGGFPSRPTFQTVKVLGTITGIGPVNGSLALDAGGIQQGFGRVLSAGTAEITSAVSPLGIGTNAAQPFSIYTNALSRLTVDSNGGFNFAIPNIIFGFGSRFAAGTSEITSTTPMAIGTNAAQPFSIYTNATPRITIDAAGVTTINGLAVPKVSYGVCNGNNTIGTGAKQNLASCSGTAGSVLVTFTSPYAVGATCTATVSGVNSNIVASVSNGAITSSFSTYTFTGNTGVANSTSFSFICVGT